MSDSSLDNEGRTTHLEVVDSSLGRSSVTGIREIANVDNPHEDADDSDNLGEQISEIIDLLLERGLLRDLGGDRVVDMADCCGRSGSSDEGESFAIDDGGSLHERTGQGSA